jgi:hypothetical protein
MNQPNISLSMDGYYAAEARATHQNRVHLLVTSAAVMCSVHKLDSWGQVNHDRRNEIDLVLWKESIRYVDHDRKDTGS